jgi:hypothetical protein
MGHILLFIPLPIVRFYLTQNIAETAQGRHILFPVLLPLAFLLLAGLKDLPGRYSSLLLAGTILFLLASMAVVVWPKVTLADAPYLPVRTSAAPEPEAPVGITYAGEIELIGLNFPSISSPDQAIPLTLVWRSVKVPSTDYWVRATLFDAQSRPVGLWRGQPVNGRYPARAWEQDDVIYHLIWIPVLAAYYPKTVGLEVFNAQDELIPPDQGDPSIRYFDLPPVNLRPVGAKDAVTLLPRGDRLTPQAPYPYRATIAMSLSSWPAKTAKIALKSPESEFYPPEETLSGNENRILLFEVDWSWSSGSYDLIFLDEAGQAIQTAANIVTVKNNLRLAELPPVSRPLKANFAGQFVLEGYDLPLNRVEPGGQLEVTLFWQNLQITNTSYKIFNHLLNAAQTQHGGRDRTPQNFYSTILWQPGEVVVDRYSVPVDADAPAGIYWLDVGVYPDDAPAASPLPLVDNGVALEANSVRLGPIKVGGQPSESVPPLPPQFSRDDQFGEIIALRGYSIEVNGPNEVLRLDSYWSPLAAVSVDYTLFVHLVDAAGAIVAQADGPPVEGLYPTSFWEVGEEILDRRRVSLADLSPGNYQIRLGWYDLATGQRLPVAHNPAGFIVLDEVEWDR